MRSDPLDMHADLTVVRESVSDSAPADNTEPHNTEPDDVALSVAPSPARGRASGWVSEVPLALVIAGVGLGLVTIALHHFRWGSLAISVSVLAAGAFRLVLPARKAGLLVVRGRFTDVVTMALIGGALFVLAAVTST